VELGRQPYCIVEIGDPAEKILETAGEHKGRHDRAGHPSAICGRGNNIFCSPLYTGLLPVQLAQSSRFEG